VLVDFALLSRLRPEAPGRLLEREIDNRVPVFTTPVAAQALRHRGLVGSRGLATWQAVDVERADAAVRVTAVPGHHGAIPDECFMPDVMGSVLEFSRHGGCTRLRLYMSGDPLEDLQQASRRHPGVDLVLLLVGGARVAAFVECDAGEARALHLVASRPSANGGCDAESFGSSVGRLAAAVRESGLDVRVRSLAPGETCPFRASAMTSLPAILPASRAPSPALSAASREKPLIAATG
jgi:hypothetical protein